MRHRVFGKQLSRDTEHRRALRRNQAASLFEHGAIRTTEIKAKELRPFVEKLITMARKNTLAARRHVVSLLRDRAMVDKEDPDQLAELSVVQKLFSEIAPRYANRPGGYTRIIHIADRRIGDAGRQCVLQLVEEASSSEKSGGEKSKRRRRGAGEAAKASEAPAKE
jgi:large subunit ribosomal protein L17